MVQAEADPGTERHLAGSAAAEELAVDFTVEGLVVLCDALDLPHPPGLGPDPLGSLEATTRGAILDSARRSLLARRMIAIEEERVTLDAAVEAFLEVVTSPGIVVRAVSEADGYVETRFYSAVPDVTVEHSVVMGSIQRFTPFSTDALLARVLQFLRLAERPDGQGEAFDLTTGVLAGCAELLAVDDPDGARKVIEDAGVPVQSAEAFVRALRTRASSSSVTILHRPTEDHVAGGELTWIDAGDNGLWLTPLPADSDGLDPGVDSGVGSGGVGDPTGPGGGGYDDDPPDLPLRVERTSAASIAAELLSYLPGGDTLTSA